MAFVLEQPQDCLAACLNPEVGFGEHDNQWLQNKHFTCSRQIEQTWYFNFYHFMSCFILPQHCNLGDESNCDDLRLTSGEAGEIHYTALQDTTQLLNKRANSERPFIHFLSLTTHVLDIEKALIETDDVASNQESIASEETLILRGYEILYFFYFIQYPLNNP